MCYLQRLATKSSHDLIQKNYNGCYQQYPSEQHLTVRGIEILSIIVVVCRYALFRLNAQMTAKISFFPVDNGDMTLIVLDSGLTILIDINIRCSADDPKQPDVPDVLSQLKNKLGRDAQGRKYVDVFVLTHPDKDHCSGLVKHFHLGQARI
jgi:beta-lactamase superfamily II metal-dependent hydrolase